MNRDRLRLPLAALGTAVIFLVSSGSFGHHSRGHVDFSKEVEISGIISEYDFQNPHVYVTVTVTNEDGSTDDWLLETLHTMGMMQLGWDKDSFQLGDRVSAKGAPNRNPERTHMMPTVVVKEDGTEYWASASRNPDYVPPAPPASGAARSNRDITGGWVRFEPPKNPAQPGEPRVAPPPPPYNDLAKEMLANMDTSKDPALQCDMGTMFSVSLFPLWIEEVEEGYRFVGEFNGESRIVHMNQESVPEGTEPTREGYAKGRWEGDTLIVEISHFVALPWALAEGLDSSAEKQVTERYRISDQGRRMDIESETVDPVYLTGPLVRTMTRLLDADHEPTVYECDVESAHKHLNVVDEHAP